MRMENGDREREQLRWRARMKKAVKCVLDYHMEWNEKGGRAENLNRHNSQAKKVVFFCFWGEKIGMRWIWFNCLFVFFFVSNIDDWTPKFNVYHLFCVSLRMGKFLIKRIANVTITITMNSNPRAHEISNKKINKVSRYWNSQATWNSSYPQSSFCSFDVTSSLFWTKKSNISIWVWSLKKKLKWILNL